MLSLKSYDKLSQLADIRATHTHPHVHIQTSSTHPHTDTPLVSVHTHGSLVSQSCLPSLTMDVLATIKG